MKKKYSPIFRSLDEIITKKFFDFFAEHGASFDENSLKAFLDRFDADVDNFLSREHYNIVCNEDDLAQKL